MSDEMSTRRTTASIQILLDVVAHDVAHLGHLRSDDGEHHGQDDGSTHTNIPVLAEITITSLFL